MQRRILVLFAVLVSTIGLAACGDDDNGFGEIPRSTPELTVPPNTSLGTSSSSSRSGTTGTTGTTGTQTTTTPATTTPTTSTPATGGATPGNTQSQPNTGGASPGAFSEFCKQNPGACPGG